MRIIARILAWLGMICGLIAFLLAWGTAIYGFSIWNAPAEYWFYDSIGSYLFGLWFLIYSIHSKK